VPATGAHCRPLDPASLSLLPGEAVGREAVARDGQSPFLREVVGVLDKPGGGPQGDGDDAEGPDRQGYYKPGEVVDVLEAAKAQARHS